MKTRQLLEREFVKRGEVIRVGRCTVPVGVIKATFSVDIRSQPVFPL